MCQEAAAKSAALMWAEDMLHFLLHRVALLAELAEVMSGTSWMTYWVHGLDSDDKSDSDENKSMEDLRGAKTQERR